MRPTEIQGALGLVQLRKLSSMLNIRRKNAEVFMGLFSDDERFIIQKKVGEPGYFGFVLIIHPESGLERDRVFEALRRHSIEFRIITGGCLLEHDVINFLNFEEFNVKNARYAHKNGFFVGNAPLDLRKEIEHLYKVLKKL